MDVPFHPIAVHFAIALLVTGAVADLAFILLRAARREADPPESLRSAALWMQVGGALGAVVATTLVHDHPHFPDHIAGVEGIREVFELHEELGESTMWAAIILAGVRAGLVWKKRLEGPAYYTIAGLGLGVALLVSAAGFYGGQLTFEHSVGIQGYLLEQE